MLCGDLNGKEVQEGRVCVYVGFPVGSAIKSVCNTGVMSLIPGLGRSPGKGNGNTLQYSCLGNPMDRRAWQAMVHRVPEELDMI